MVDVTQTDAQLTTKATGWRKTYKELEGQSEKEKELIQILHNAAKSGSLEVVMSLVGDSRLNPNSRDRKGWTALLRAAKADQVEVIRYLLEVHADINTSTKEKNTALHKAAKRGRVNVAKVLCLHQSAEAEVKRTNVANVNAKNNGGATPLMLAAMGHQDEIVKVLLHAHADPDVQKDVGYTALMLAARHGYTSVMMALLQAKASLELADKRGETAMVKATKYNQKDAVEILSRAGAAAIEVQDPGRRSFANMSQRGVQSSRSTHRSEGEGGYPTKTAPTEGKPATPTNGGEAAAGGNRRSLWGGRRLPPKT